MKDHLFMIKKCLILLTLLLPIGPFYTMVFAYEIDYTKGRFDPLADSLGLLNAEVKRRFNEVLQSVNKNKLGCDGFEFRKELRKAIANDPDIGEIERWAEGGIGPIDKTINALSPWKDSQGVPRHKSDVKTSIFRDAKDRYVFHKVGLGSNINVNGHLIGTDKLGHFFDQGYGYYFNKVRNGRTDSEIFSRGRKIEGIEHGSKSNGMLSNADLAANYYGFQFWKKVTDGNEPYFKCQDGRWRQEREFTWAEYVRPSWDEGINCNEYVPDIEQSVKINLKKLNDKPENKCKNRKFDCPMSEEGCLAAFNETASIDFLHKDCYDLGRKLHRALERAEPINKAGQSK
ncbi:MAG: hypothetical protein JNM39_02270 [Bdellovibrionaceae bacterium]|nr:hypothetical protein [Pseudobdellovibrionaceae bacterium]